MIPTSDSSSRSSDPSKPDPLQPVSPKILLMTLRSLALFALVVGSTRGWSFLPSRLKLNRAPHRSTLPKMSTPARDSAASKKNYVGTIQALMSALEELYDAEKAAVERRRRIREMPPVPTAPRSQSALIVRERLERAIVRAVAEQEEGKEAAIEWPVLRRCEPNESTAINNILPISLAYDSRSHRIRIASGRSATPGATSRNPSYLEPTHANDAWLLSALIWNWRHCKQFRSLRRRAHQPISAYAVTEAARLLRTLINEYRGGRRPTSEGRTSDGVDAARELPTRSVRQLVHRHGGELSELLQDFDAAFEHFAP